MKMTKKLLLAAAVLTMASFGFMACSEDDDENEMIEGSGSNFSTHFYNDTGDTSRAYKTTRLKHDGELLKIVFDSSKNDGGVLGFIWDFDKEDESEDGVKRNFFVAGLSANGHTTGKISAYVSKYFNITDINAKNFGAPSTEVADETLKTDVEAGKASEKVHQAMTDICNTSDDPITIWVDIYPTLSSGNTHKPGTADDRSKYTGGYTIDLWVQDEQPTEALTATDSSKNQYQVTIEAGKDDATKSGYEGSFEAKKAAVYLNVYNGYGLNGSWTLVKDYHEAETVAE